VGEAWVVRGWRCRIYAAEYSAACGSSKRMPVESIVQRPKHSRLEGVVTTHVSPTIAVADRSEYSTSSTAKMCPKKLIAHYSHRVP